MPLDNNIDVVSSADERFQKRIQAIKEGALEEVNSFLKTQGDDARTTLKSAMKNAKMHDDRVSEFAGVMYRAAGWEVVNELQRGYEEQLNDLMAEVGHLKKETIVFSTKLTSVYEEQRNLKLMTRVLDITLVLIGGVLSIISLMPSPQPRAIAPLALLVLLIIVGVRFWNEWDTTKNLRRMKRGLDQSELDEIYDRITEKRHRLGKTLIEYAGQHRAESNEDTRK